MIRSRPRFGPPTPPLQGAPRSQRIACTKGFRVFVAFFNAYFFCISLSVKDSIGRHCMGGVSVFVDVFGRRIGGCASRYHSTYGLGGMYFLCISDGS